MTRFDSSKKMKEIMGLYYLEAKNASHNKLPLAWITSGAPVEFLYAMDIIPVYPENYAAMCAITGSSRELIEACESKGYPAELCSYARTDIGVGLTQGGPLYGLPEPDFLLAATNICHTVVKWYQVLARTYDVPLFVVDMPFLHRGLTEHVLDYMTGQFNDLVLFLEKVTGGNFNESRFMEVLELSLKASSLWKKVLETGKIRPSPINSFDTFIHMAPIVTLRGTNKAIEYYNTLLKEIEDMVEQGKSSIPNEKIRLLWDNLPVWYQIKYLSDMFGERGAALVVSTYTNSWAVLTEDVNIDNARKELSRAYVTPYINRNFEYRVDYLVDLGEEFSLDGYVFHSNRSCKPYSLGQYYVAKRVKEITKKPVVVLEADMNDPRSFSRGQIETRVEAFLEEF